jgi:hypothetical protein
MLLLLLLLLLWRLLLKIVVVLALGQMVINVKPVERKEKFVFFENQVAISDFTVFIPVLRYTLCYWAFLSIEFDSRIQILSHTECVTDLE